MNELRQTARALPAYAAEAEILDAIRNHQVVVIEGPTGSGKTTQVPQMVADAGITDRMIGITQPRRIAAVSVAWRIAAERGVEVGQEVGYAIRFDDQTSDSTQIKVMTDGILLQEARTDADFERYGVLIIDEAHERTLNIDFILGLLHRALLGRADLRVVVSSATLNPVLFQRFFAGLGKHVPLVSIPGRPFPVDIRWRPSHGGSYDDLVESVCRSVERIEENQEEGHVLVFLSGAGPIRHCEERLRQLGLGRTCAILPLFGALTREEQEQVFEEFGGKRKVVLATNIAETSLTVPGVRHVIDSGLVKVMHVNPRTGVRHLREELVSQASADQRAGRAGRTAPGTCIRLYGKDEHDRRPKYAVEEVLRLDLREVVLRLIDLGVTDVEQFRLPTRPPRQRLKAAIGQLIQMQAIDADRQLTSVGKRMVPFPLTPQLARAVIAAADEHPDVVDEVLMVAATLSGRQPWVFTTDQEAEARAAHRRFHQPLGDAMTTVELLRRYHRAGDKVSFCERNHLDPDVLGYTVKAHGQLREMAEEMGIQVRAGGRPENVVKSLVRGFGDNLLVARGKQYETQHGLRVSVHPGSAMWRCEERFLLSTDLIVLRRPYAAQVSLVKPEWLAELVPELAREWGVRARRSVLHKRNVERDELPENVAIAGVQLPVSLVKGRGHVSIPSQHVGALAAHGPGGLDKDLGRMKSSIEVGAHSFSPGVPLRAQLAQLRWMTLPGPDDDLDCTVPEGALLDVERNLHAIGRYLPEMMQPMLPTKGKRPGWCALVANGAGSYWFEVIPGFRDAVHTSVLSLGDLDERLEPDDPLLEKVRGQIERWLPAWEATRPRGRPGGKKRKGGGKTRSRRR